MSVKDFKIWLINHDYTHERLANRLQITSRTISGYVAKGRFPEIFVLALKGLENE